MAQWLTSHLAVYYGTKVNKVYYGKTHELTFTFPCHKSATQMSS